MKKIAVSSSLKHKELIKQTIANFAEIGITALFPNLDGETAKENVTLELMQTLERDHFDAINNSQGLYVLCPDGIVGTLVSVEIGYASAQNKPIFFSKQPQDLGLQALATFYVTIEEINKIKTYDQI